MSQLGTGGLVFVTSDDVSMDSEDLSVGPEQVKVVYQFTNTRQRRTSTRWWRSRCPTSPATAISWCRCPTEDADNLFGFTTTFDGEPVDSTLHQYAFAVGVDQTALLKRSACR